MSKHYSHKINSTNKFIAGFMESSTFFLIPNDA